MLSDLSADSIPCQRQPLGIGIGICTKLYDAWSCNRDRKCVLACSVVETHVHQFLWAFVLFAASRLVLLLSTGSLLAGQIWIVQSSLVCGFHCFAWHDWIHVRFKFSACVFSSSPRILQLPDLCYTVLHADEQLVIWIFIFLIAVFSVEKSSTCLTMLLAICHRIWALLDLSSISLTPMCAPEVGLYSTW